MAETILTIEASGCKAKCLRLMDDVAEGAYQIVITKNGRPVSRLVPYRDRPKSLFGIDRGRIEIIGDSLEPIDVEWEADAGRTWSDTWFLPISAYSPGRAH